MTTRGAWGPSTSHATVARPSSSHHSRVRRRSFDSRVPARRSCPATSSDRGIDLRAGDQRSSRGNGPTSLRMTLASGGPRGPRLSGSPVDPALRCTHERPRPRDPLLGDPQPLVGRSGKCGHCARPWLRSVVHRGTSVRTAGNGPAGSACLGAGAVRFRTTCTTFPSQRRSRHRPDAPSVSVLVGPGRLRQLDSVQCVTRGAQCGCKVAHRYGEAWPASARARTATSGLPSPVAKSQPGVARCRRLPPRVTSWKAAASGPFAIW